ncbi:MAG: TadE/TadG family type IV pilus assembly protein [Hyphomicrobiaceae bacterium]
MSNAKHAAIRSKRVAPLRRLKMLRRNQDGFTAVEFALVIGPFLALLFAIMEVALVYFATFSLENATEQASRLIRTGQAQGFSAADFKDAVCERVPAFMSCEDDLIVDVRTFPSLGAAAAGAPTAVDNDGNMIDGFEQFNTGGGGSIVLVNVYYHWKLFAALPDIGYLLTGGKSSIGLGNLADGSRLITSATVFKNEPFDG